jgi:hypothetical protein
MVAPAVPNDRARLRFFVASTHTEAEIDTTVQIVVEAMRALGDDAGARAADDRADRGARPSGVGG